MKLSTGKSTAKEVQVEDELEQDRLDEQVDRMPSWFRELRNDMQERLERSFEDMLAETMFSNMSVEEYALKDVWSKDEIALKNAFPAEWLEWLKIREEIGRLANRLKRIR
jgi:hypothetical protein